MVSRTAISPRQGVETQSPDSYNQKIPNRIISTDATKKALGILNTPSYIYNRRQIGHLQFHPNGCHRYRSRRRVWGSLRQGRQRW